MTIQPDLISTRSHRALGSSFLSIPACVAGRAIAVYLPCTPWKGSRDVRSAHHPASFRSVAVLREDPPDLQPEDNRVDLGQDLADHAATRHDAADRRFPAHAGDADRRGHLLRHAMHHARAGAAVSGAEPAAEGLSRPRL